MPLSYFPKRSTIPIGVEKGLLESLFVDYYIPTEYDGNIDYPTLRNGKKDGVFGLYYRDDNLDLPVNGDIKGVKSGHQSRTAYYEDLKVPNWHKQYTDGINKIA
jgi:hypothetical protein